MDESRVRWVSYVHVVLAVAHATSQVALAHLLGPDRTCVALQSATAPAWDSHWHCGALVRALLGAGVAGHAVAAVASGAEREGWGWAHLLWWRLAATSAALGSVSTREVAAAATAAGCVAPVLGLVIWSRKSGLLGRMAPGLVACTVWVCALSLGASDWTTWPLGAASLAVARVWGGAQAGGERRGMSRASYALLASACTGAVMALLAAGAHPVAAALCLVVDAVQCAPWRLECTEDEAAWIGGMVELATTTALLVRLG